WAKATWTAELYNPTGAKPVYSNGQVAPVRVVGSLDSNGRFLGTLPRNSQITPNGTQWTFTICSLTSAPCQTILHTGVDATSFNAGAYVSSQVTAPRISGISTSVPSQPLPNLLAYNATEVINRINGTGYTNTSSQTTYVWNGGWVAV